MNAHPMMAPTTEPAMSPPLGSDVSFFTSGCGDFDGGGGGGGGGSDGGGDGSDGAAATRRAMSASILLTAAEAYSVILPWINGRFGRASGSESRMASQASRSSSMRRAHITSAVVRSAGARVYTPSTYLVAGALWAHKKSAN